MARPKRISDEMVLERLLQTLVETGADALTFQRASAAAGLSAATLVQRFGSRENMIEAALLLAWDRLEAETRMADAHLPATPGGAISLLLQLTPADTSGNGFADGLLLLREDFRNPVLRARGADWGHFLAGALGRRLSVSEAEATRLGWQMASLWQGALLWWGFTRDGTPGQSVRHLLEEWCAVAGVPAS
ncbi:TetR family transcriptional regulator [Roseibium sp. Sym1]|uniref:TetR family transcriptional regulator n=1 Tax=Roseibium sp. Sym1 TaxID=3016006 RepID=UPI0022B5A5D9|nr:TetR family transcriptional regulator [Roseibium sp. Sym1]